MWYDDMNHLLDSQRTVNYSIGFESFALIFSELHQTKIIFNKNMIKVLLHNYEVGLFVKRKLFIKNYPASCFMPRELS